MGGVTDLPLPAHVVESARVERSYVLAVDLGQLSDPTAYAVVERAVEWRADPNDVWSRPRPGSARYGVVYLERAPLGTSYTKVAERARELLRRDPLALPPGAELVVDASGVGLPVVDMWHEMGLRPIAVTITSGDGEKGERGRWRLGKMPLISRLQARLHDGSLRIAERLPLANALVQELSNFRFSYSEVGNLSFAARSGAHDDLVLATALGIWWLDRPRRPIGMVTLYGT